MMAKKKTTNEEIFKRFERKEKGRVIDIIDQRVYFLIVCEGTKTEPNYFRAFENILPRYSLDIEVVGTAKNTLQVIDETISRRNNSQKKYDSVWAVFDKDSFPADHFDNAIKKGNAHNIKCAYSNEAFELWYILHFVYLNTGISRLDYQKQIEHHLKQKTEKKFKYKKNDQNMFSLLKEHGSQKHAILRAKKLEKLHVGTKFHEQNPCTRVYALVEELNNPNSVLDS